VPPEAKALGGEGAELGRRLDVPSHPGLIADLDAGHYFAEG
jgi:hypothetical protein